VVGPSAEEDTQTIQDEIIPMLEKWDRTSGAKFEAEKTSFIYLTRYREAGRDATTPIRFKGQEIPPAEKVNILGVTLDKELRFKAHLADKAGKATKVTLALRRLKGLQPKSVKQLTQRTTAQAVIRGFRTVALSITEVEAGPLPLEQRLRNQEIAFWVSIHKLGKSHPHWVIQRQRTYRRHRLPLQRTAVMCEDVQVDRVIKVKPYACPLWVHR
ncbi:hypothetical protein K469DRAFT_527981, partial [Zopfia rhizophila CBS 207.26]